VLAVVKKQGAAANNEVNLVRYVGRLLGRAARNGQSDVKRAAFQYLGGVLAGRAGNAAFGFGKAEDTAAIVLVHVSLRRNRGPAAGLLAAMLAGVDGGAGLAVGFAALLGLALVPVLLTLGQGEFAFDAAVAEVEAGGDERMAFDLRLRE